MPQERFVEEKCAVGGSACSFWLDWHEGRRYRAMEHPRAKALSGIKDDTAYSEALDDLAEELDSEYAHPVPACSRPGCKYAPAA